MVLLFFLLSNDPSIRIGYNDILLIPVGATNIKIREMKASNNYLAVRNTTGHYYLNGNWRIDFPREMKFAGCTFHYERKPHAFIAPETITALGPTTEALYIVVSFSFLFLLIITHTKIHFFLVGGTEEKYGGRFYLPRL